MTPHSADRAHRDRRSAGLQPGWPVLSLLPLLLAACPAPKTSVVSAPPPTPPASDAVHMREQLQLVATKAMCTSQVQRLIKAVQDKCNGLEGGCSSEECRDMVRRLDLHGRFLLLMREVPHSVVYLNKAPPFMARKRRKELEDLLAPPWLDFARILVVGHFSAGESQASAMAQKHANKVRNLLMQLTWPAPNGTDQVHLPESMFLKPLYYDFPLSASMPALGTKDKVVKQTLQTLQDLPGVVSEMIRLDRSVILDIDKPYPDYEPPEIENGVWVFLLNCYVPDIKAGAS